MMDHLIRADGLNRQGIERVVSDIIPAESLLLPISQTASVLPQLPFNPDIFKDLLLCCIVMNQVAFNQAISPFLRFIFSYLCAVQASFTELANAIPTSSSTIKTWIIDCFSQNKSKVRSHL